MKKVCIVCLLILLVVGCVPSRPRIKYVKLVGVPKITAQEASSLPDDVMAKLIKRDEMLKSHILTLEAKIDLYNESVDRSHR